jgi:phosphatidylglycerophosphate synthase
MKDGRKIPRHINNSLSGLIDDVAFMLNPVFRVLGFTPNILTTFSLGFGMLSIWSLYHDKLIASGVYYWISHLFDCFDGNFARTYGMVTKFGDYYDHIKDWAVVIFIWLLFLFKTYIDIVVKVVSFVVYLILLYTTGKYIGCQEKMYGSKSGFLNAYDSWCIGDPYVAFKKWKWFSPETKQFILSTFLIAMGLYYKKG